MLSAYLDIRSSSGGGIPSGGGGIKIRAASRKKVGGGGRKHKKQLEVQPSEACTTSVHAAFVPLPPETNVPRPAETGGRATWQVLDGTLVDDNADGWDAEAGPPTWEDDRVDEDDLVAGDDASEPDFEPDSLDPDVESSLSSSVDEISVHAFLSGRRCTKPHAHQATPVYSGPQLCCEDDGFDDD